MLKIKCKDKKLKKLIKWCANYYNITDAKIRVVYKKNLNFEAVAGPSDKGGYEIIIRSKWSNATIFHEMTHIKQFYFGELSGFNHKTYAIWKGSKYYYNERAYFSLPWEIEARAAEGELHYYHHQHS